MRALRKAVKNGLIYWFVRALLAIGSRVPLSLGRPAGAFLGELAYWVIRPERRRALGGLATAFPDRPEAWRRATARACFRNLGRGAFEAFRLPRMTEEELTAMVGAVEGVEHLDSALARGGLTSFPTKLKPSPGCSSKNK